MFKKFLFTSLVFIILMVGGFLWELFMVFDGNIVNYRHKYRTYDAPVDIGMATVYDIADKEKTFDQLVHKPTLVMLWATWCGICAEEMKEAVAFAKRAKTQDINVLFVAVPTDKPKEMVRFMDRYAPGWEVPLYHNSDKFIYQHLGLKGVPSYLVLNSKAQVVATVRPKWNGEGLEQLVKGK